MLSLVATLSTVIPPLWTRVLRTLEPEVISKSFESDITWPEGPLFHAGNLYFTDPITALLWKYNPADGKAKQLALNAGGCKKENVAASKLWASAPCDPDQAEPGANGMAVAPGGGALLVAQHGMRRIVKFELTGSPTTGFSVTPSNTVVADAAPGGLKLNYPNDLVVRAVDGSLWFTDPFYGGIKKSRASEGDQPYTEESSELGYAGVYRVPVGGTPQLMIVGNNASAAPGVLDRPNGISFSPDYKRLYVATCCQGHSKHCPAGHARWTGFDIEGSGDATKLGSSKTVTWEHPTKGAPGCADGHAVDPRTGLIVSSCPLGICIVDFDGVEDSDGDGQPDAEIFHLSFGDAKVSNVAFGDGYLYLTGVAGPMGPARLWRLPLA
jgi:sugar lactone lactonase YvrE